MGTSCLEEEALPEPRADRDRDCPLGRSAAHALLFGAGIVITSIALHVEWSRLHPPDRSLPFWDMFQDFATASWILSTIAFLLFGGATFFLGLQFHQLDRDCADVSVLRSLLAGVLFFGVPWLFWMDTESPALAMLYFAIYPPILATCVCWCPGPSRIFGAA